MKGKYKLTRFARFIIFLALISPACYLGSTYYQGDFDMQAFADKINIEWNSDKDTDQMKTNQDEIEDLKEEIDEILEEIKELKNDLSDKSHELNELILHQGEV